VKLTEALLSFLSILSISVLPTEALRFVPVAARYGAAVSQGPP
jgi:hypothetical protein